jgi:hypothetical protein
VSFHGQKRSNETHESKTDPEAKLARKADGQPARLSYAGHALMENRNGLLVDLRISEANGRAERDTALFMLVEELPGSKSITVGADKGYDSRDFVDQCRFYGVVPHIAQHTTKRRSAIDLRTTRHHGYSVKSSRNSPRRIQFVLASCRCPASGRSLACASLQPSTMSHASRPRMPSKAFSDSRPARTRAPNEGNALASRKPVPLPCAERSGNLPWSYA